MSFDDLFTKYFAFTFVEGKAPFFFKILEFFHNYFNSVGELLDNSRSSEYTIISPLFMKF